MSNVCGMCAPRGAGRAVRVRRRRRQRGMRGGRDDSHVERGG